MTEFRIGNRNIVGSNDQDIWAIFPSDPIQGADGYKPGCRAINLRYATEYVNVGTPSSADWLEIPARPFRAPGLRDHDIRNPREGQRVWNRAQGCLQVYDGSAWVSPMGLKIYQGAHIAHLSRPTNWTIPSGNAVMVVDHVNTYSETGQALKVVADGANDAILQATLGSAINIEDETLYVRFYVHDESATTAIKIHYKTDADNYYTHEFKHSPTTAKPFSPGWNHKLIPVPAGGHADRSATGSPDDTNVNIIELEAEGTGGHDITWDCLTVWGSRVPGIAVLSYDDGDKWGINTAKPHLDNNGYAMTAYLPGQRLDDGTHLTTAECDTLYAAGWDIAAHSFTNTNFTLMSGPEEQRDEMQLTRDLLEVKGWTPGCYHGSWTNSAQDLALRTLAKQECDSMRHGVGNDYYPPTPPDWDQHFWLPGRSMDGLSDPEFESEVDAELVGRKATIHMYYHTKTEANFQHDVEYLRAKEDLGQVRVMTVTEYCDFLAKFYRGAWVTDEGSTF